MSDAFKNGGKFVRLASGGWAQVRPIPVVGIDGLTMMVAVELTKEELEEARRAEIAAHSDPLSAVH